MKVCAAVKTRCYSRSREVRRGDSGVDHVAKGVGQMFLSKRHVRVRLSLTVRLLEKCAYVGRVS